MNWDKDWLETMYNNRARVPEAESYIARWIESSAIARTQLASQAKLNIAYGDSAKETLDIFLPEHVDSNNPPPVFVFIHGGYWHALDKDNFSFIAPEFVKAGACVVVVNYTLCPNIKVSGIVKEIERAIIWIKRNIAQYGANPEHITVSGHSAGGHLTAMTFTHDWLHLLPELNQTSPFKNGLALSGLYDMAPLQHTPFLQILALDEHDVEYSSPITLPCLAKQSVLSAIVGGNESEAFIQQNQSIQNHWGKEIVPVCQAIAGLDHFSIVEALVQPDNELHKHALKLLQLS